MLNILTYLFKMKILANDKLKSGSINNKSGENDQRAVVSTIAEEW